MRFIRYNFFCWVATIIVFSFLSSGVLLADEIFLRNGNRISGNIVQEASDHLVVQVDGGKIKVYRSEIRKIVAESRAPAREKPEKSFDLWNFLTEKISGMLERKGKPLSEPAPQRPNVRGFSEVTGLKTAEWMSLIFRQAFGDDLVNQINRERMTRFSFFVLVGIVLFSFIMKALTSLMGSPCAVSDAMLFQGKIMVISLVVILLVKGALPLILLLAVPDLKIHAAAIEGTAAGLTWAFIVIAYFYLAKKNLELMPFQAAVVLAGAVGFLAGLRLLLPHIAAFDF